MRREIVKIEQKESFLRQKSKPVEVFDAKLHELLDDMKETMYHADGLGLAAVQVGVLRRIFILRDEDKGENAKASIEFINPVLLKFSGSVKDFEGCLSIKGRRGVVSRPKKVVVKAQDRFGEFFTLKTDDNELSAAISHELDHLDGVLYIDKLCE